MRRFGGHLRADVSARKRCQEGAELTVKLGKLLVLKNLVFAASIDVGSLSQSK